MWDKVSRSSLNLNVHTKDKESTHTFSALIDNIPLKHGSQSPYLTQNFLKIQVGKIFWLTQLLDQKLIFELYADLFLLFHLMLDDLFG